MPRIAIRLESNHVRPKDAFKNLLASTEASVKLAARERYVEEEADIYVRNTLSQQTRKKKKLIIMDNDYIARFVNL